MTSEGKLRSKIIAAVLALFLGFLGAHRFYLRQPRWGFAYLAFFLISVTLIMYGIGMVSGAFLALVVLVDFVRILATSKEAFDLRYNKDREVFLNPV